MSVTGNASSTTSPTNNRKATLKMATRSTTRQTARTSARTATAARIATPQPKPARKRIVKTAAPVVEVPTHPLAHLVPIDRFAKQYVHRTIDGFDDLELMRSFLDSKENLIISGPTGCGKTHGVYAYAATNKMPLVNVACNGAIDPDTLFGRPTIETDANGRTSIGYIESDVVTVIRHGGLLNLDEINFSPPRINSILHGLLDHRRTLTIPELGNLKVDVSPDLQIVASMNVGYEGTKPLNKAFWNRFAQKWVFDYSREIEEKLVTSVPSILDVAEKLRKVQAEGEIDTPIPTNLLQEFEQHAIIYSPAYATTVFVNSFIDSERSTVRDSIEHYRDQITAQVAETLASEEIPEEEESNS